MQDVKPVVQASGTPPATGPAEGGADAKRLAARRRFLARGAVAGSGFLIVTLYHQRGMAGSKKIFTSTAEMCLSLGGTPGKSEMVPNPENPAQKMPAIQCSNPKPEKLPWMMK